MEKIGRDTFGAAILVNHRTEKKKYDALVQFSYWVCFLMNLRSRQLFALLLQVCVEENTSCKADRAMSQVCSPRGQQNRNFHALFRLFVVSLNCLQWTDRGNGNCRWLLLLDCNILISLSSRRHGLRRLVLQEHAPVFAFYLVPSSVTSTHEFW